MSEKDPENELDAQAAPVDTGADTGVETAGILVGENIRVFPDQPLQDFDLPDVPAFAAGKADKPEEALFARICDLATVTRGQLLRQSSGLLDCPLMLPMEWGVVDWPGADRQRYAIVFPRPKQGPLMLSIKDKVPPYDAESITKNILEPLTQVLEALEHRGMVHRAIRPDNLYHISEGRGSVLLGEFFSTPPGSCQPTVFETIEMAMTPPLHRGAGSSADDFYALGATLLTLSMGFCPAAELSARALIDAKLHKGSYSALMAGEKPSFGLRELLRGLLTDDPVQRWGLEELAQWAAGVLHSSVQEIRTETVDRPFPFDGGEYRDARTLAYAFGESWSRAEAALRTEAFGNWLNRNMTDDGLAESIGAMLETDSEMVMPPGRLASRISMLLDSAAPMRFKSLVSMPYAMGPPLAVAFINNDTETIKAITEALRGGVMFDWYSGQTEMTKIEREPEIADLKQTQALLSHNGPGYGIERCLYMMNRTLPCLSPIVGNKYLDSLRELLPTLETIVMETGELQILVDRHLPAFIASRISGNLDRQLARLEDRKGDGFTPRLAMIEILAKLQQSFGPEELPHLTGWLARELEPAVARLNSRKRRELAEKKLEIAANGGNLAELNKILNNESMVKRDEGERRKAAKEWTSTTREIASLESSEFLDSAQRTGWRIATMVSGLSAVLAFVTIILW